jgi:predicted MPP superfamily phosphohydrolase
MNFFSIITIGYIAVASIIIAILLRDIFRPKKAIKKIIKPKKNYSFKKRIKYYWQKADAWFVRCIINDRPALWVAITILGIGILAAIDMRFVEPNLLLIKNTNIKICGIDQPIKIALITDMQAGNHKKSAWVEKIVNKIEQIKPDLVILGGDLIDNEGTVIDESVYLAPLAKLVGKYPVYYILGNHEYGIGSKTRFHPNWQNGDKSAFLIERMKKIGIPLLRNQLACTQINLQNICLFGTDDIWKRPVKYDTLRQWDQKTPLILLSHNPDGILYWPNNVKRPSVELSGHTHGGQIWLPFIGPLGDAQLDLPGNNYYKGLNLYGWTPVLTSNGTGESGGSVRFFAPPEIDVVTLTP